MSRHFLGGCNDGDRLLRAKQCEIEARGHYANAVGFDIIEEIRKATLKELACYPLHAVMDAATNQGVPLRPITPDDTAYFISDAYSGCTICGCFSECWLGTVTPHCASPLVFVPYSNLL
ncbi:hypothetical protein [Gynuella sp.]|uniref:hypothetical protein n=1 Tax=Gynuella sp. TaxID=2969146 RepID=UPI003D0A74EF